MQDYRRTLPLVEVHRHAQVIQALLEYVDAKTDYALRSTLKSMRASVKDAFESAISKCPAIETYEKALAADDKATIASCADGAKAHLEMLKMDVSFEVYLLQPAVLDKEWPHIHRDAEPPSEKIFLELLAALELIVRS